MVSVVLGIDIGTTSVSVVAVDEVGRLLKALTRTHCADVTGLPTGYSEQNPADLLEVTLQLLTEVADMCRVQAGRVVALGLTGQMHGFLLSDGTNNAVSNIITWQDQRSFVTTTAGKTLLDLLLERTSSTDLRPTGCQLASGYLGTTVFALQQLGQWPDRSCRVTFVADWIASQLCDQLPVTDVTHAASSGLFDLEQNNWSQPLLDAANVQREWLPQVCESGQVLGVLSGAMVDRTGLPHDVVVCNSIGDNQASVLSCLPDDDETVLINIGTGGQIAWRVSEFLRVEGLDTRVLPAGSRHGANESKSFMLVGAGLCGGDAIAWLNDTLRLWLLEFGVTKTADEVWDYLKAALERAPDRKTELTCEPFFGGTRPIPQRRAVFAGVGRKDFTPVNVARSIFKGIADTMKSAYSLADTQRPCVLNRVVMSGNASRRNPDLVKAVEQAFGVAVELATVVEEAATGAALLAGCSVSIWADVEAARVRLGLANSQSHN